MRLEKQFKKNLHIPPSGSQVKKKKKKKKKKTSSDKRKKNNPLPKTNGKISSSFLPLFHLFSFPFFFFKWVYFPKFNGTQTNSVPRYVPDNYRNKHIQLIQNWKTEHNYTLQEIFRNVPPPKKNNKITSTLVLTKTTSTSCAFDNTCLHGCLARNAC